MRNDIEIWRPVVGYEGLYEVSNLGRVKTLEKTRFSNLTNRYITYPQKIMSQVVHTGGYCVLSLRDETGKRKQFKVHRLVAEAFIPNPYNLPIINHRNEIKTDNRACNLEWCTQKYNVNYGTAQRRRIVTKNKKFKQNEEYRHRVQNAARNNGKKVSKAVVCIELNLIFPSIKAAARFVNKTPTAISLSCRKGQKTFGCHWKYVNE